MARIPTSARQYEFLDWRHDAKVSESRPCVLCGSGAILRHPVTGRPCHKVCHDGSVRTHTSPKDA
jgi:hypothetical protein